MKSTFRIVLALAIAFALLMILHIPLLRLPYFWDEAGYYVPAALDFLHHGWLIPQSTLTTGHTPLLSVYLALAWRVFGYSPLVTRAALILVAACTLVVLHQLGKLAVQGDSRRETALWSAVLLALSPLFFAQSSMAHLDLLVALFTLLSIVALLRGRWRLFAAAASLAFLSKETAVIMLPVAWLFARFRRGERRPMAWIALLSPLLPAIAWALYYHHATGFWTGNAEYLHYNFYSTLNPVRIGLTLMRRLQELFLAGFTWVLLVGVIWGTRVAKKAAAGTRKPEAGSQRPEESHPSAHADPSSSESASTVSHPPVLEADSLFLAGGLCLVYVVTLSVVGGAVLPRYLLPVMPVLYLVAVVYIWRLGRTMARSLFTLVAVCFVASWFINPPYPFPFENNLAYADFVDLHQRAAKFLERQPGNPLILTAWPATGELNTPHLGYVSKALRVTAVDGFTERDFAKVNPLSFDVLYLYSRKWEPPSNWMARSALLRSVQRRYFDYQQQIPPERLEARYHLQMLASFDRRGQWVRIYLTH